MYVQPSLRFRKKNKKKMKTAVKLILIYLLIQVVGVAVVAPAVLLLAHLTDMHDVHAIIPSLIVSMLLMLGYLYKKGYLTGRPNPFAGVRPTFCLWAVVAGGSFIVLEEGLVSLLSFLPNWMDEVFEELAYSWWGIGGICLLGPVLEEVLFRGAVTKHLLERYRPCLAILLSGLLFGLFHINPVQVVAATLSGWLLGWLYWRSGSLWPSILVHVMNNSFSVYLMRTHPDIENFRELFTREDYLVLLMLSALLLGVSLWAMQRSRVKPLDLSLPQAE